MKFETKEPTFLRFAEVSPVLAHQPHTAVAERMADGDRLGIDQVEYWLAAQQRSAGEEQVADQVIQCVQTGELLLVTWQMRKGRLMIVTNLLVGLFQTLNVSIAKTSSPSIFISLQSWAEYLLR